MTSPSPKPSNPNLSPLSDARWLSVLPERRFVQMVAVVQIKFKSSVAPGMHPSLSWSQTGTNGAWLRHCAQLRGGICR